MYTQFSLSSVLVWASSWLFPTVTLVSVFFSAHDSYCNHSILVWVDVLCHVCVSHNYLVIPPPISYILLSLISSYYPVNVAILNSRLMIVRIHVTILCMYTVA